MWSHDIEDCITTWDWANTVKPLFTQSHVVSWHWGLHNHMRLGQYSQATVDPIPCGHMTLRIAWPHGIGSMQWSYCWPNPTWSHDIEDCITTWEWVNTVKLLFTQSYVVTWHCGLHNIVFFSFSFSFFSLPAHPSACFFSHFYTHSHVWFYITS